MDVRDCTGGVCPPRPRAPAPAPEPAPERDRERTAAAGSPSRFRPPRRYPVVDRVEPFDARVERRGDENRELGQVRRLNVPQLPFELANLAVPRRNALTEPDARHRLAVGAGHTGQPLIEDIVARAVLQVRFARVVRVGAHGHSLHADVLPVRRQHSHIVRDARHVLERDVAAAAADVYGDRRQRIQRGHRRRQLLEEAPPARRERRRRGPLRRRHRALLVEIPARKVVSLRERHQLRDRGGSAARRGEEGAEVGQAAAVCVRVAAAGAARAPAHGDRDDEPAKPPQWQK